MIEFSDSHLSINFLEYVLNPIIHEYKVTIDNKNFMVKQNFIHNL